MRVVDLSVGIDLLEGACSHEEGDHNHDHGVDPHIWLSPKTVLTVIENSAQALIHFDPACKELITTRKDSMMQVVDDLDQRFTKRISELKNKKFVIFHPALTYLANDYGMEQIPMELDGKSPSPVHLKNLVDRVKAENIPVIFIQKEFDKENAQQLSLDTGAKVVEIDPLEANWFNQMETILLKLQELDRS